MEDQIPQIEVAQQGPPQAGSFSPQSKAKSSGSKWLLIFIGLLILGGAGIFFFTKSGSTPIATPTPTFKTEPIQTTAGTATPTSAPVKKDEVSIEIQNGTGITGEAKLLQDKLKVLGYSDITVGNASSTDNTDTTVTFLKTLSQTVQDEIKKELEKTYKTVTVKTSTTQKSDILILTGLRSGSTAITKPATSGTPKASGSASPSASPKATSTSTN